MTTFCVTYRGNPVLQGNFETPAGAMARGVGVVRSSDTVVEAGAGVVQEGFLNTEVTTDGPTYEELMHIGTDSTIINEKKVSTGVVQVTAYDPGTYYVMKGNVKAGTTFAVDEYVFMAASGEFTDLAGASAGDTILGVVSSITATFGNETDCVVWQAVANLGDKV